MNKEKKKRFLKSLILVIWIAGFLVIFLVSQFRTVAAQLDNFHISAAYNFRDAQLPSESARNAAAALQVTYWGYPGDSMASGSAGSQTVTVGDLVSGDRRLGIVMLNSLANKTSVFTLVNATNFRIPFMILDASTNQTYLTGYALEATAGVSSSYVITEEALGLSSSAGITFRIVVGVPFRYNETAASIQFVARLPDGSEQYTYEAPMGQSLLSGAAQFATYSYLDRIAPTIGVYSPDLTEIESVYYSVNSYTQTVYIPYYQSGRKLTVEYYSGTDPTTRIGLMQYNIAESAGYRDQGTYAGQMVVPQRVYYPSGTDDLTVKVYLVDTEWYRQQGFVEGLQSAKQDELYWQDLIDQARQEGYDSGKEDGYDEGISQNVLLQEQIDQLKEEYNAITAFFDGSWNSAFGFFDYVGNGIAIGGISLKEVVITLLVCAVVVLGIVWLVKK